MFCTMNFGIFLFFQLPLTLINADCIYQTRMEAIIIMNYRIEQLNPHTWLIEEYDDHASAYMYLLEGERAALLIDTGFGTIPLKKICEELTAYPIVVALTHGHVDHIGGTGAFEEVWLDKEDEQLYHAHSEEKVRRIFTHDELLPVKKECRFFTENMVFELGARSVHVIKTPGHSIGSVCFWDEKNRWMFTGDTCCKAHVLLQMDYAATMETYRNSLEKLLSMEEMYDLTWPGHHSKPVEKYVIKDFLTAVNGILVGSMKGVEVQLPMGKAHLLEYREIGIEY